MTTAQYKAELEAELAELRLTQAIRADRLRLAHQIAELRERQAIDFGRDSVTNAAECQCEGLQAGTPEASRKANAPDFIEPLSQSLPVRAESLCELRPGIGLCDDCSLPKWPQKYVGLGCMVCLDCLRRKPMTAAEHNRFPNGRYS